MSQPPAVSVVLPVRNGAKYLKQAIDSILGQSLHNLELIVVDDGSTDETPVILKSFADVDDRVRVYTQPQSGLVKALNAGVEVARGDLIARMDSDDVAHSDRLQRQCAFLAEHPHVGVIGGAAVMIDSDGRPLATLRYPCGHRDVRDALTRQNVFIHSTVVMRRRLVQAAGGYRLAFVHAEDYDLWLRLAERAELANLREPVVWYRTHPEQVSVQNLEQQVISAVGAQLSARLRAAGRPDPFEAADRITAHMLMQTGASRESIEESLMRAIAAQATVLGHLGRERAGCALLEEAAAHTRSSVRISRQGLAQLAATEAWLLLKQGANRQAVGSALRALGTDPIYTCKAAARMFVSST